MTAPHTSGEASPPRLSWIACIIYLLLGTQFAAAIELDVDNKESIKRAASIAAKGMLKYYTGDQPGQIPGILPSPEYYWWEGGAMWMSLIDYWRYTGDDSYNDLITQGIQFQQGPDQNFMVLNWSAQTGNDDEAFWAFGAMGAAELKFPNPPKHGTPWLTLAQATFNVQTTRFTDTCGGGLPWQVFITSAGYNYKNSISNGCFFNLAARLTRYTGNKTYAEWGVKAWDWEVKKKLITSSYQVLDGVFTEPNCSLINAIQFTYNAGVFLHGAAVMWNHTQEPVWRERVHGLIRALPLFFQNGIMYEQYCEPYDKCNQDQKSFKAYLSKWMADTIQLAPFTRAALLPLLKTSAKAAAEQCIGGHSGTECGMRWTINGTTGHFDGNTGPGQQMAAMAVFGALMVQFEDDEKVSAGPVTHKQGISHGNPGAGLGGSLTSPKDLLPKIQPPTLADIIGAWIITAIMIILTLGGAVWTLWPEPDAHLNFIGGVKDRSNETKRQSTVNGSAVQEKDVKSADSISPAVTKHSSMTHSPRPASEIRSTTDGKIVRSPMNLSVPASPRRSRSPAG